MHWPSSKKIFQTGISFHQDEIRLVCLQKSSQQISVVAAERMTIPSYLSQSGQLYRPNELATLIQNVVSQLPIKKSHFVLALPHALILQKYIKLPSYLREEERASEISGNLSYYFPEINEALHFDYVNMGRFDHEHDALLLVAVRSEHLQPYLQALQLLKIQPHIVDVDVFALARFVSVAYDLVNVAILEIDALNAQLIVVQQQKLIFHKIFSLESSAVFKEQFKIAWQFVLAQSSDSSFKKIFLSGRISSVSVWRQDLQMELVLATEAINPFMLFKNAETIKNPSLFSVACGLAARSRSRC